MINNSANVCDGSCFSIKQLNHGLSDSSNRGQKLDETHYMVSSTSVNDPSIKIICSSINYLGRKKKKKCLKSIPAIEEALDDTTFAMALVSVLFPRTEVSNGELGVPMRARSC